MKKLILALMLSIFVVGLGASSAMADSIMFPWIAKNTNVTTLLSVINTSEITATCRQNQENRARLHFQYWWKQACRADSPAGQCYPNLTGTCEEYNLNPPTSQNDILTFDAGGIMNLGQPLFNDLPGFDNIVNYGPNPDFSLRAIAPNPSRAFLLVDNNDSCFEDWDEATLYGEAMVLELDNGAGWGYVAYNAAGGGLFGPNSEPTLGFADESDMQGEVLRSPRWDDDASDSDELEATPTVLLPLNKFKTKFFMTPTNYVEVDDDLIIGARTGGNNARLQLCYDPQTASGGFPFASPCGPGDFLSEDSCQSNAAATCARGGIFDNDETPLSSTVQVDVVCTGALDINATSTGTNTTLLNAGQISYLTTYGGAAWTYVRSMVGAFWPTDALGTRNPLTRSDMLVGKLEFTEAPISISGTAVGGEVNDFKQIRNSASLLDWSLRHGINLIIQPDGFGD